MRELINLPSGSGKTYSFQTLASEGYAIIDLDAFVFKTGNGYVYHSDTYGYLKSLNNVLCVGALTNDRLLDCFDKIISLDKDGIAASDDVYLNTIYRNYIKGFSLNGAFSNKSVHCVDAYNLISNEALKGNRVNADFPSMVNLQLRYAWKHRHLPIYNFIKLDDIASDESIDFFPDKDGFLIKSKVGTCEAHLDDIRYYNPSSLIYTANQQENPEDFKQLGLSFLQTDDILIRDLFILEKQNMYTFYDCRILNQKKAEMELTEKTVSLIKKYFLSMNTWFTN